MEKNTNIVKKSEVVDLAKPMDVMGFADNLKEIIVKKKLFVNVKGNNYVNVEGWQIAGAFCGVYPLVTKLENISDENAIRYRAEVDLINSSDGEVCGRGMAICTNKEAGKTNFAEFAVASMAQTRAVGKALRLKLGWLIKLAGYEATPAEEMSEVLYSDDKKENKSEAEKMAIDSAIESLEKCENIGDLQMTFIRLDKSIKSDERVIKKKDELKEKLNKKESE